MAARFSIEAAARIANPGTKTPGDIVGARLKRVRGSFDLATVGALTIAEWLELGRVPIGSRFAFLVINSSVTLGATTIAVGVTQVHATNTKYKAAAVFTTPDTPTLFGPAVAAAGPASTIEEIIYLTFGAATMPVVGIVVVDFYYSAVQ